MLTGLRNDILSETSLIGKMNGLASKQCVPEPNSASRHLRGSLITYDGIDDRKFQFQSIRRHGTSSSERLLECGKHKLRSDRGPVQHLSSSKFHHEKCDV